MKERTVLLLLVALFCLIGSAHAATVMEIDSGTADGSYLQVHVAGIASATSLQFDLTYDPAVVSIAGIRKSAGYESVSMTINTDVPGTARVLVIFPDPVTIQDPAGVVEVAFSPVAAGTSTLSLSDARWSDFPAFASLTFDEVKSGTVTSTITPDAQATTVPPYYEASSGSSYDPGAFTLPEDTVEIPAVPEQTVTQPAATQMPAEPALPTTPATEEHPVEPPQPGAPDATPAPAPVAALPIFIAAILLYRRNR
ncbi:MAG: hypothetical protein XE11_1069 [Methanomicrobiales archaeon 53_19]|uniref:cohesin domain-containing protein n=1 Tax=Methanocalculus sp. TaxID=2004547 RepID=UPI0007496625|nr:cohesin domain-containing protein [Methanocalculus sp.]KUK70750.1 MAG: hypothetical protein XD88_0462 [Methanocalculus sp. 52_23]KUL03734.1 MAG: hypothetical protein XE11_1069 [Methanomicrobiales archaeon 53_19]HIJ07349.1 hypothetical protein [Methanocalculus sp.]